MKKKAGRYVLLLTIFIVLYFSIRITAFNPFDLVEKLTPQPVYSILDGLEVEKRALMVDQLSVMNDTYAETQEQKEYTIDTVKLVSILLGNSNLSRSIDKKVKKIINMDIEDIISLTPTDIRDILLDMGGNIIIESSEAEPTEEQLENIATMIAVAAGMKRRDAKAVIDKVEKVVIQNQMEEKYLTKLAAETQTPVLNEEGKLEQIEIKNSTPAFIEEKRQQLKVIEDKLYEAEMTDNTSLIQQIKINNQLQLLNAQISLKILNSLNLINEGNYLEMMSTREDRLKEQVSK